MSGLLLPRELLAELVTQVLKQKQQISQLHDAATDKVSELEDIRDRADSVYNGLAEHFTNLDGLLAVMEEGIGVLDDGQGEGLGSY